MAYQFQLKKEVLVTVPIGLEQVALQEMQEIWHNYALISEVKWQTFPGCLRATGLDEKAIIYINLYAKTASRVLCKVSEFYLREPAQFKQSVRAIPWSDFMKPEHTFRFETTWQGRIRGSRDVQSWLDFNYNLNAKDAVADHFNDKFGERPNVDKNRPDLRWRWILSPQNDGLVLAELFWDTSGQALYYRYPERKVQRGSLHPHLANGILRWAGYKPGDYLLDLFAGSGTFLLEAHQISSHLPNFYSQQDFAFSLWPHFRPHWPFKSKHVSPSPLKSQGLTYLGVEISQSNLRQAQKNSSFFDMHRDAKISWAQANSLIWSELEAALKNWDCNWFEAQKSHSDQSAAPNKIVIAHPPYGLDQDPAEINLFYQNLGSLLKHHLKGCKVIIFSANKEALKHIGLKPQKKLKVINEGLEGLIQEFNIY